MGSSTGSANKGSRSIKIDDLPLPLALIHSDGHLLDSNAAFLELTGFTIDELKSSPVMSKLLVNVPENGASNVIDLPRKDASHIEAEVFLRRVTDRDSTYYSACVINIPGNNRHSGHGGPDSPGFMVFEAMDSIREPLIITDRESKISFANRAAGRFFKPGPEGLAGQSLWKACPELNSARIEMRYGMALKNGTPQLTREHFNRRNAWYEMHFYPYRGGMAILMMNITSSVHFELWSEMSTFALNKLSDYVLWVTRDGRIYYANAIARKLREKSAIKKESPTIFDLSRDITPASWQHLWEEAKKACTFMFDTCLTGSEGASFPADVSANYIHFQGREYVCLIARDITERRRAGEEVRMAREQAELYLDLMAHDINNMNQIGIGYLELAMGTPGVGEEVKDMLSRPMEAFISSSRLISSVKNLQKAHEDGMTIEPIDASELLAEVKDAYSNASGREIKINYNPVKNCSVKANRLLLEVFANLVSNAIKHSSGPLTIDMRMEKVVADGRQYCEVTIQDTGPGIPDEAKARLFVQRYAGERSMRRRGIGLFIVKTLLDDFHGSIRVEDRVPGDSSKGTRFVVTLPSA